MCIRDMCGFVYLGVCGLEVRIGCYIFWSRYYKYYELINMDVGNKILVFFKNYMGLIIVLFF